MRFSALRKFKRLLLVPSFIAPHHFMATFVIWSVARVCVSEWVSVCFLIKLDGQIFMAIPITCSCSLFLFDTSNLVFYFASLRSCFPVLLTHNTPSLVARWVIKYAKKDRPKKETRIFSVYLRACVRVYVSYVLSCFVILRRGWQFDACHWRAHHFGALCRWKERVLTAPQCGMCNYFLFSPHFFCSFRFFCQFLLFHYMFLDGSLA